MKPIVRFNRWVRYSHRARNMNTPEEKHLALEAAFMAGFDHGLAHESYICSACKRQLLSIAKKTLCPRCWQQEVRGQV